MLMYCCSRQQRQNKGCFISMCPGQYNEFPNWVSKHDVRCDWNGFQGQWNPWRLVKMIFMVWSSWLFFFFFPLSWAWKMALVWISLVRSMSISTHYQERKWFKLQCCLFTVLICPVENHCLASKPAGTLPDDIYRYSGWTQLPPNTLQPSNEASSCPTLRINHSSVDSWATVPALLCLPAWSKSLIWSYVYHFLIFSDVWSIWIA